MVIKQIKLVLNLEQILNIYDDFNLGFQVHHFFMKKLKQISTASARQKKQEGNYFDTFLNLNFDYDKRNQKFQTTDGFRI